MPRRSVQVVSAALAGALCFLAAEQLGRPRAVKRSEADWFLGQGEQLFRAKQYVAARNMLERCTGAYPKVARCHALLGAAYDRLDMPDAAYREYVKALDVAPDETSAAEVRAQLAAHVDGQLAGAGSGAP